jgi:hypothetical protein
MNDYTLALLATDRTTTYRREADQHRLAAQARRSNDRDSEWRAPIARRSGICDVLRRLSLLRSTWTRGRRCV